MNTKVEILNVGFNPTDYQQLLAFLSESKNRKGYVCFPDIYNILRANEDETLKNIYDSATLTLPDGKPSEFLLHRKGYKNAVTISGYWLCKKLLNTELSHFFYGSSDNNLKLMMNNIKKEFPGANIAGSKSPPFLEENQIAGNAVIKADLENIRKSKPDIIWVGISSPKQDLLMYYHNSAQEGTIMIGVGAVFDYFAGKAHMGPEWIKKLGLRWFYQLLMDPKRYYSRLAYIFLKLPVVVFKKSS